MCRLCRSCLKLRGCGFQTSGRRSLMPMSPISLGAGFHWESSSAQANLGGASGLFLPSCGSTETRFMSMVSRACTRPFFSGLTVKAAAALARARCLVAAFPDHLPPSQEEWWQHPKKAKVDELHWHRSAIRCAPLPSIRPPWWQ